MALPHTKVQRDVRSQNPGESYVIILLAPATGKVRGNFYSLMKITSYSHITTGGNCKNTEQYEIEEKPCSVLIFRHKVVT
jgi:hypothetical protein